MSVNLDNFGFFDYVQGEENDLYEYTSDEYSEIIEGLLGTGILKYTGEA